MMTNVVGVVFQPGGKVYSFDPAGLELRWDEKVICQTARGRELGRVVQPNHESDLEVPTPLKRVVRRADTADRATGAGECAGGQTLDPGVPSSSPASTICASSRFRPRWCSTRAGSCSTSPARTRSTPRISAPTSVRRCIGASNCARSGPATRAGCAAATGCAGQDVLQPLPLSRAADHAADGQGSGAAHEPWPHHRIVRASTLLLGVRTPCVSIVSRSSSGSGPPGDHAARRRSRAKLRSAERCMHCGSGGEYDGGSQVG